MNPTRAKIWLLGAVLCAFGGMGAGAETAPLAGEFKPDVNTLFLAHFDDNPYYADYALGISRFAGNGAQLADGYYGKGIDLRPRGLFPDFLTKCEDFTPIYIGWGFQARGNVNPAQGTFECWFQCPDTSAPRLMGSVLTSNFLSAELARVVRQEGKDWYNSLGITISQYGVQYCLPTLGGKCLMGQANVREIKGFEKNLDPKDWHHYALTWSQGEMVMWLDGRPLISFDMTGQSGLAFCDNAGHYVNMADCVIDELRISNVVRYQKDFEPAWRDGKRPACAFTGAPNVKRFDAKLFPAPEPRPLSPTASADLVSAQIGNYTLRFNRKDGALAGFQIADRPAAASTDGLLLYSGFERRPLAAREMSNLVGSDGSGGSDRSVRFDQAFDGGILAHHELSARQGALLWRVTLTNLGEKEAFLEPLLSIPLPLTKVTEVFDGLEPRKAISLPRHRDEYVYTLPFTAACDGQRFVGVGIDPHTDMNDLVNEWIPAGENGILRQGTKVALSPRESFTYDFYVVAGRSDFGTLDAISSFHDQFPDLYRLQPDVPVYNYLAATGDWYSSKQVDMKRLGYAGSMWCNGPGADQGDEFGNPRFWDNPQYYKDPHYNYTRRLEVSMGCIAFVREYAIATYREGYDNFYCKRRCHYVPDLCAKYLIDALWPGYVPNDDPLTFGQYYGPITGQYTVNEFNTPLGNYFRESTARFLRQTAGYNLGFINDMSIGIYRCNDPIAQKSPGRSFSRDLGAFVRTALGRKQRYEMINRFVDNGYRSSIWSDGGFTSYTLSAYSSALAFEGSGIYQGLTAPKYFTTTRNLLGEKPISSHTQTNDDWIGMYAKPNLFPTIELLRDYYRYSEGQLILYCMEQGITLDPTSYLWGRQATVEAAPAMIESTVLGRQVTPAARVRPPLWVRRAGHGLDTFWVVGNSKPSVQETDLEIIVRYFNAAPILAAYYGGETAHAVTAETTVIKSLKLDPRSWAAFKTVALLDAPGSADAVSRFSGDALSLQLELAVSAPKGGKLLLTSFGPVYEVNALEINGKPVIFRAGEPLPLQTGANKVRASYSARSLRFSMDDWNAVELIKDGKTNFCLIADAGVAYNIPTGTGGTLSCRTGFEHGTARMLNDFIEQYDDEDGRMGNLEQAQYLKKKPDNFAGWTVTFTEQPDARPGRVLIDRAQREIRVEGAAQGEIRRAMVVLMRMVDRKYPHVGRFFPFRYHYGNYEEGKPIPLAKWIRKPSAEFFAGIPDPKFVIKPLLRKEYDDLYKNDNMDFAGKYSLRWSPYIFEPTYGDNFVYGYTGVAEGEPREELMRLARPLSAN